MSYSSVNPFNGKLNQSFVDISDVRLEEKLASAEQCFKEWKQTSYTERAVILNRPAVLMRERVEGLAHTMTLEMGKRINEARGEVMFSADILAGVVNTLFYADNCNMVYGDAQAVLVQMIDAVKDLRLSATG